MRHILCTVFSFSLIAICAMPAQARDTHHMFPIDSALNQSAAEEKLNDVKLFFGESKHPEVVKRFGEYQTNKKTRAFGKSDEEACQWAFLSAMIQLQERALSEGGNAVINIKSYYKADEVVSETEYECGAGAIMAGVTFKGTVVELAQ